MADLTRICDEHLHRSLVDARSELGAVVPTLIIDATARFYGYTPNQLLSPARTKNVAHARQTAMWLCRQLTTCSYPELGDIFDRDHTTIIHGVTKIQHEIATKPGAVRQFTELANWIRQRAFTQTLREACIDEPQRRAG
jgi:chromosomal replication initiation ATPase DnaA